MRSRRRGVHVRPQALRDLDRHVDDTSPDPHRLSRDPPLLIRGRLEDREDHLHVDPAAAALAGLIAGPIMEIPAYVQRALGLPLRQDVFAEGGRILGGRGLAQRPVGYLGHAVLSVVIALFYVGFFGLVGNDHLLWWGLVGGLVHFTIGGYVVAAVFPVIDPGSRAAGLQRVGFAYRCYGMRDVATFLAGHLSFGLLVGLLYPAFHRGLDLVAFW